jgi:hypothetical protein
MTDRIRLTIALVTTVLFLAAMSLAGVLMRSPAAATQASGQGSSIVYAAPHAIQAEIGDNASSD